MNNLWHETTKITIRIEALVLIHMQEERGESEGESPWCIFRVSVSVDKISGIHLNKPF